MRAGNAGPGSLIRRRRREVALMDNIRETGFYCMTLNLRLTYDLERLFYIIGLKRKGQRWYLVEKPRNPRMWQFVC